MRRVTALCAGAVAAYVACAAGCPSAQRWGRGFHRGSASRRRIALSFDDGPSDETERILDVLAEHDARATFFVCGLNVARQAHAARRALSLGHEIGNHTHTHPLLLRCGPERVRWEVSRAQREIEDRLGVGPHMFRPPYGVRSPWLPRALEAEGLLCAHWSVIGNDWKLPAERIAGRVLQLGSEPGAIVCLHDGDGTREHVDRRATTDALRTILPALKGQGFELTTVSDAATAAEVYNSASAGAFNSPTDSI